MKKHSMVKGVEYIRIAPAIYKTGVKDYSYSSNPMVFDEIDANGNYIMHYPAGSFEGRFLGTKPKVMEKEFSDNNWRPVTNLYDGVKTKLNLFRGKLVRRVKPVLFEDGTIMDIAFMREAVKLVSATRYHVTCQRVKDGDIYVCDSRYANPDDWTIA